MIFCVYCILCVLEVPINLFPLTVDEKSICDSHPWFSRTLILAKTIYCGSCFGYELGTSKLGNLQQLYFSSELFFFSSLLVAFLYVIKLTMKGFRCCNNQDNLCNLSSNSLQLLSEMSE